MNGLALLQRVTVLGYQRTSRTDRGEVRGRCQHPSLGWIYDVAIDGQGIMKDVPHDRLVPHDEAPPTIDVLWRDESVAKAAAMAREAA